MTVRFHPAARDEIRNAHAWYEERSPLAALGFAQDVDRAIQQIAEAPTRHPEAAHDTRRVVLSRFPFTLFYRAIELDVVVIAVAHQKRRPGYWAGR